LEARQVSNYDIVLVIWGTLWMLGGAGLVYLMHRVVRDEELSQSEPREVAHRASPGAPPKPGARAA